MDQAPEPYSTVTPSPESEFPRKRRYTARLFRAARYRALDDAIHRMVRAAGYNGAIVPQRGFAWNLATGDCLSCPPGPRGPSTWGFLAARYRDHRVCIGNNCTGNCVALFVRLPPSSGWYGMLASAADADERAGGIRVAMAPLKCGDSPMEEWAARMEASKTVSQ